MWDITGTPYKHAISAIYANRELPKAYLDKYFLKETYLAVYRYVINLAPSMGEWEHTDYVDIHPNIPQKPVERPKKKNLDLKINQLIHLESLELKVLCYW